MKFVDTNILLYAAGHDRRDERKLLTDADCAISAQVLAEFFWNAIKPSKLNLPHSVAVDWIEDLRRFPIVPVTADLVARGAANADRYQISHWDGAIIAAAQEIGAEIL